MHHHIENESSLFSLLLSCLLCLLSLSLSFSVSACLCLRVLLRSCCCGVLWCVMLCCVLCCGVCGACPLNTSPCVHSTRPPCVRAPRAHVLYMWTCCRYTRRCFECTEGHVLSGHTGTFRFIGKTSGFTFLEHLNRMLGSPLIANFLLTKICPHVDYHVLQRFTKETLGSYLF